MAKLGRRFYNQDTNQVARQLLGKILVRPTAAGILKGRIVEVESYLGKKDRAAHVQDEPTERTKVIFKKAGRVYVYLCYGVHWQFNITTTKDKPECILIRALEPVTGSEIMKDNRAQHSSIERERFNLKELTNGPGKLCQAFQINEDLYGEDLVNSDQIWINHQPDLPVDQIKTAARVGVNYAGSWADKKLRFYIQDNDFVSTV